MTGKIAIVLNQDPDDEVVFCTLINLAVVVTYDSICCSQGKNKGNCQNRVISLVTMLFSWYFQDCYAAPCTTLMAGKLPAIKAVQGDCERV